MDNALWGDSAIICHPKIGVLILVLMDNALWASKLLAEFEGKTCLNPCSNG